MKNIVKFNFDIASEALNPIQYQCCKFKLTCTHCQCQFFQCFNVDLQILSSYFCFVSFSSKIF